MLVIVDEERTRGRETGDQCETVRMPFSFTISQQYDTEDGEHFQLFAERYSSLNLSSFRSDNDDFGSGIMLFCSIIVHFWRAVHLDVSQTESKSDNNSEDENP